MADYGIGRQGGSLRDALNQIYPMTGLGEYTAGYPPGGRVGITAPRVPPQGGPVIPPVPPVPAPTGAVPPVPGMPPNPQDDQARATLIGAQTGAQPGMMGQGPPNYAAQLGLWKNNMDRMVVPPYGLPPDRNTINPDAMMPVLQQYRRAGQENI